MSATLLPEVTVTATRINDTSGPVSPTASPFAALSCSIEVYMFEGGSYSIVGGQIRDITFSKALHGGAIGTAMVQLAPGGPNGPESVPTWSEIVTPMSHVLIGMTRGNRSAIVLDGIVVRIIEDQEWQTSEQGATAGRVIGFECADLAWFFRSFNWYALTFLGLTAGAPAGNFLQYAPAGVPYLIDQGLIGGNSTAGAFNPREVAEKWYTKVMASQGGILGTTFVPYQTNTRILFHDILGTVWEDFPNAFVPFTDYFLAAEQTWMDKFLTILPHPWYEFFVTTAPDGFYPLPQGASGDAVPGKLFTMATEPLAKPAGPQLVARVKPVPTLSFTREGTSQAATIGDLDMTRWNALPIGVPDAGFINSSIDFDAEGACNFYTLNPTAYTSLFGDNNSNNILWNFYFGGAADIASIHRYGFRPAIGTFRWFFDPQGTVMQNPSIDIPQSAATMLGKYISWLHPAPLMAKAATTWPLMPDIMIGTRFRYAPFKDGITWDFYVENVQHHFSFGGLSTTSLTLTRGLPTSIYADGSAGGVLQAIHTGTAMRKDGVYQVGLPPGTEPGLITFGPPESITAMAGRMAQIFVTPQAPGS